ncbi:aspartate/glutamate racemase family protein [Aquitalea sp. ASV11]|uniref:aspartate/glutamate racemase family protein n=1 Tax=Aquitalea sp. ASV11 TaxID=2795103 RepID=UPI0018EDC332|nr:amino acid racemase [Aquitalea sp. ASV11]
MKAAVIGIAGVTVPGALDCLSKMHQLSALMCGGHHHHPRFVLDQPDFGVVHAAQLQERWDIVEDSIVGSLQRLAAAGAQVAVIPANTVHCCIDGIRRRAPLPLISMLDVVAAECRQRGLRRVGVLGTRWTMQSHLYRAPLAAVGVEEWIPDEAGQAIVQRVIFEELVPNGSVSGDSLQQLLQVVADLRAAGCDGVALACTELPLVLDEANCGMAAVDTTAVLARAAMQQVLA